MQIKTALKKEYKVICDRIEANQEQENIFRMSHQKIGWEHEKKIIDFEIQKQKLENRKCVIQKCLDDLKIKNIEKDMEDEEQNIGLQEQYNQLDILTTKKVLTTKFMDVRDHSRLKIFTNIFSSAIYGFLGAVGALELCILLASTTLLLGSICGTVFIGTSLTTYICGSKEERQEKKLFDKLNAELNEFSLPNTSNLEQDLKIQEEIEATIIKASRQLRKYYMRKYFSNHKKRENEQKSQTYQNEPLPLNFSVVEEKINPTLIKRYQ